MPSPRATPLVLSVASGVFFLTALIGLCGGASRDDVAINPVVQLLGVILIFLVMMSRRRAVSRGEMRAWLTLVLLLALWIALQLVPLPPALWSRIPANAVYIPQARAIGIQQPWRPISLSPMNTWLSLVGMTVPIGLVLGWNSLDGHQVRFGRMLLTFLLMISILLGLAQISGGIGSGLYLFENGSPGFPAGLFANRNHQAAALAMAFPLMAITIVEARIKRRRVITTIVASCAVACVILPMLLVNGSRAGLVLAMLDILLSAGLIATYRLPGRLPASGQERLLAVGAIAIPFVVVAIVVLLGRAAAIERLTRLSVEDDQRYRQAAIVLEMIRTHFPFGAGYGSFPDVFRVYEPFESLKVSYFNHAHNDVFELAFEGGLPSIILAICAAVIFIRQSWIVWTTKDRGRSILHARAAGIMIVTLLAASISDYPLRAPTIQVFAVVALAWLASGVAHLKSGRAPL